MKPPLQMGKDAWGNRKERKEKAKKREGRKDECPEVGGREGA